MFSLGILYLIPVTKEKFTEAHQGFAGCFAEKGIITSSIGPLMLGMGMTLSGAVSIVLILCIKPIIHHILNLLILQVSIPYTGIILTLSSTDRSSCSSLISKCLCVSCASWVLFDLLEKKKESKPTTTPLGCYTS